MNLLYAGVYHVMENIENEIWKSVVDYEGLYEVSNLGNIRSIDRKVDAIGRWGTKMIYNYKGQPIKSKNCRGYRQVIVSRSDIDKTLKVHREVAKAFIPNPENKYTVNHINGIKHDNRVENLEWATTSENTIHAYKIGLRVGLRRHGEENPNTKISNKQIEEMRQLKEQGMVYKDIGKLYNICRLHAMRLVNGNGRVKPEEISLKQLQDIQSAYQKLSV